MLAPLEVWVVSGDDQDSVEESETLCPVTSDIAKPLPLLKTKKIKKKKTK